MGIRWEWTFLRLDQKEKRNRNFAPLKAEHSPQEPFVRLNGSLCSQIDKIFAAAWLDRRIYRQSTT
jgi:hypothetical protein